MKNNMKLVTVFYITLLAFSLSVGIIYAFEVLDASLVGTDFFETFRFISINNLLIEVGVLAISFLLSFILIGELIFLIYFLFKSFSFGFMLCTFIKLYSFKGILLSLIYFISQMFIFFIYFFFLTELFKIFKRFINYVVLKKDINTIIIFKSIKKLILLFSLFIIYNVFLYFLQSPIINLYKIIVS